MPVTAKLSRKFYERFGDEIAGELVDWFNAVDASYQGQMKEMNELNWQRFKATLEAESASLRAEISAEISALRAELRAEIRAASAELRADLMRWMFIYWTGSFVGLGGLIVGMALFGPR